METQATACVGIDISKLTFDACLLRPSGKPLHKPFDNTPDGHAKLLRWVRTHTSDLAVHFCMEATGTHGTALAEFLAEAGMRVSVENPALIKAFRASLGAANKTDKADAQAIALYCRERSPDLWRRACPEVRELMALLRRQESLQGLLQQERCRASEPGLMDAVRRSLDQTIAFLQTEMESIHKQVNGHIRNHPHLKRDQELLTTIPGIGDITALRILAELPDVRQFESAKAAAAFCGLNPTEYRSGTSVRRRTRMSKAGNSRLRKWLYFPAMAARRCNPFVKSLYERLTSAGKCRLVALGAAMRKLLMIAFGVLKHQTPFSQTYMHAEA
jgi:transposase